VTAWATHRLTNAALEGNNARVRYISQRGRVLSDARQDWKIIEDIARALERPHGFEHASPREIFEELRIASKGGVADY
jgi:predicted molibdopterin-dependent oxidoreductase YjgC